MNEPLIDRCDTYQRVVSQGLTSWHGGWAAAICLGHSYSALKGQWDDRAWRQQQANNLLVLLLRRRICHFPPPLHQILAVLWGKYGVRSHMNPLANCKKTTGLDLLRWIVMYWFIYAFCFFLCLFWKRTKTCNGALFKHIYQIIPLEGSVLKWIHFLKLKKNLLKTLKLK